MPAPCGRRSAHATAGGSGVASPPRVRRGAIVAALALCSAGLVAHVHGAAAIDPARAVTAARAAVDRTAVQYFALQRDLQSLDRTIARTDGRIADASRRADATRAEAATRAAMLYRAGGFSVATDDPGASSIVVARGAQLLDSANASAQHD